MKSKEYTVFPYFDDKHGGEVPQSFEYLEELPRWAIKLQCSNVTSQFRFPVDTHIHRLMYRWNLTNGKMLFKPKKMRNVPEEIWNDLHLTNYLVRKDIHLLAVGV
jgi:endonuclease-3